VFILVAQSLTLSSFNTIFGVYSVKKRAAVLYYLTYTSTFLVVKFSDGNLLELCSFFLARDNGINPYPANVENILSF
jgi:hypothetical protein